MKIYIAGPYTGDELENTTKMIRIFNALLLKGHVPFCPLLSHYANEEAKRNPAIGDIPSEIWMKYDLQMLITCGFDALYFMGVSPGANAELAVAESLGMKIYRRLEDL